LNRRNSVSIDVVVVVVVVVVDVEVVEVLDRIGESERIESSKRVGSVVADGVS